MRYALRLINDHGTTLTYESSEPWEIVGVPIDDRAALCLRSGTRRILPTDSMTVELLEVAE